MVQDKSKKRTAPTDNVAVVSKKTRQQSSEAEVVTPEKSDDTLDGTVYQEDLEKETTVAPFVVKKKVLKVTESPNANDDNDALVDFDSTTIKRIMAFQNYADPSTNTFAVDKLPKEREWGTKGPFEDKSTILCKPGTNEPYIVWIVGRVSRTWFFDRESNPAMQVAINIVPINDPTGTNTRQTICVLSKPPISSTVDGWGDLRATKWQNSRSVGGSDGAPKAFIACYDARSVFRAKKDMELYAPELLQTKDLVMIEVSISRFRIQEEDDKPKASSSATKYKSKSLQWEKWRAHLELRTVSLISKAPATKQGDAGETSAVTI